MFSDELLTFSTEKTILQSLLSEFVSVKLNSILLEESQAYHDLFGVFIDEEVEWEEGDLTHIVENFVENNEVQIILPHTL